MSIYETKLVNDRNWADVTEKTIQFTRKDKKPIMQMADIRNLVKGLQSAADKKNDTIRILVRAMAPDGMKTLKGYNTDLMAEDYEDYYKNSVKDSSKFNYFTHIQITVEKEL